MIQQQIVEYARSQTQLGVSNDAIKAALIGAGWPEADVNDSLGVLDKPEEKKQAQPTTQATFDPMKAVVSGTEKSKGEPIIVSDLVANSKLETVSSPKSKPAETKARKEEKIVAPASIGALGLAKHSRFSKSFIAIIVLGVFVTGIGSFAGLLYFQKASIATELAALKSSAESGAVSSASAVEQANSEMAAVRGELESAKSESAALELELSLVLAPAGVSSSATPFSGLSGALGGSAGRYTLTTANGAVVSIENSAEEQVDSALKPLFGETVAVSGTYVPGSKKVTVTSVNGTAIPSTE